MTIEKIKSKLSVVSSRAQNSKEMMKNLTQQFVAENARIIMLSGAKLSAESIELLKAAGFKKEAEALRNYLAGIADIARKISS